MARPRSDFLFSAGFWVAPISEKAQTEIKSRFPALSVADIQDIYEWYQGLSAIVKKTPRPSDARKRLERFARKLDSLFQEVRALNRDGYGRKLGWGAVSSADINAFDDLLAARFAAATLVRHNIPNAIANITPGQVIDPIRELTLRLDQYLRRRGVKSDSAPKGPLVTLMSILLEDAYKTIDAPPSEKFLNHESVREKVRSDLEWWEIEKKEHAASPTDLDAPRCDL